MKLLAFTDTHGSSKAINELAKRVKQDDPEALICAGDVSIFANNLKSILEKISSLGKICFIIHGNHETETEMKAACSGFESIIFLHRKSAAFKHCIFLGWGGGGFSTTDKEFERFIPKFEKEIRSNPGKKVILITHGPPYGTKLDKLIGGYCGSKSYRAFLEKNPVDLHICGHIHENEDKHDKVGHARILNPGPFGKIVVI
ncbi:MAG TPA: metallophosphoesterase [Candidatus Nanoarchaeia archaeon]|nr:metallophosphoesterase [Candidatus Nanoarchaeia archaeon]